MISYKSLDMRGQKWRTRSCIPKSAGNTLLEVGLDVNLVVKVLPIYPHSDWWDSMPMKMFVRGLWIGVLLSCVNHIKSNCWQLFGFFYYWRAHSGLPCDYRTLKYSSWDYLALTISCGMIRYLKTDRTDPTKDPKEVIDQFMDVVCNFERSNTYLDYRMRSVSYWSLVLALGQ